MTFLEQLKTKFAKKRVGSIRGTIMDSAGLLIGVAIALAIVAIIAGLSILAAGTSAGLISAITQINAFLVLIGLGIAVGLALHAIEKI